MARPLRKELFLRLPLFHICSIPSEVGCKLRIVDLDTVVYNVPDKVYHVSEEEYQVGKRRDNIKAVRKNKKWEEEEKEAISSLTLRLL